VSAKLQQVHVRVNDAATGKPTPCRVRFTDAEGNYYAPFGRASQLPLSFATNWRYQPDGTLAEGTLGDWWAYIDGTCEIELPTGPLRVMIRKGPEYKPVDEVVDLGAGKMALRFGVRRVVSDAADGWISGAISIHPVNPHAAILQGAAEGLSVIDLLAYERERNREGREFLAVGRGMRVGGTRPRVVAAAGRNTESIVDYPNLLSFSGQRECLELPGHLLAVNTLNRHWVLGHVALLNCHRIVFPLRFGPSDYANPTFDRPERWTVNDWCDQCHRKKGLVVGFNMRAGPPNAAPWSGGEALAALILGKVDAVAEHPANAADVYYPLLNLGLRVPLVAPPACYPSEPLGNQRTYAKTTEIARLHYSDWIDAIRAGRVFTTDGPFVQFAINDQIPGALLELAPGQPVSLRVGVTAIDAFDRVEVVHNGKIIAAQPALQHEIYTAVMTKEITVKKSGWLAARCLRTIGTSRDSHEFVIAHTSPVYVTVAGQIFRPPSNVVQVFIAFIDQMLSWISEKAVCDTEKDRRHLASGFLDAKQLLLRKLDH
jgi:hypothetical protein